MSDEKKLNRRKFLAATGAATASVGLAGCSSGDDTDTPADTETDAPEETDEPAATETDAPEETTESTGYEPPSSFPYGINEAQVGEAQRVMEEADYGPDNTYDLDWLQYQSPAWKEMANTIRARLDSAYINMNISDADFGSLLETTEKGNHEAYTLGWVADYPGAQNFLQLIDPENTIYDAEGYTPNGARLFWSEDVQGDEEIRQYMTEQFDRIQNNPGLGEEATSTRNDAAVKMERALWDSAALLPVYHTVDQLFWYDRVDFNPPGGMGPSRAKENVSVNGIEGKDVLNGTSATFSSLDPIASGNTASGGKVINLFDAPMNYVNGTTEVEPLIVEDYSVSDDLTEYEFTLKEGIQFHGDYGEVTADDVVYSIQRLVESSNSTNTYFPLSVLQIEHETDDEGNVVSGSTAVEATGEYTFTVSLAAPFGYALEVLAYSAFSVVPEGIVGDVEGYDGDMEWQEFSTNPVGCGPFVFEGWQEGNGGEFRASAFADYHGDAADFGLHDAIITDTTALYNYFRNGNADVAAIPTSQYDPALANAESTNEQGQTLGTYGPLDDGTEVNMSETPSINTYFIGFNMEEVPKPVREAMAYVLTREDFVESVFKGRGEAAYHLLPKQVFPGGAENYDANYQG
ncbi:Dipeptide ABC transporter dipeptide-binding domain containing protein [Halorhabdus tiamatea SARL4B]|uniref:ABC-type oligopeptide transporter, periplasmic oligopeptide-binding protein OppA (TC 3.A.1.5.1) n=1 Tax=Halorhabdus tiamatea SARL4B TaxID=1033806 RepID=F7PFA7_9EURY|nr:ABC transporter substrate-binding protein [Halorhabdus tiamatea]ERJ05737.1 Dipeptide ABC transporter dipeptide-binding domain containing protein [Halorhabdus tiamatea SARL4B]CCQ33939.1 ABC-type oligopeptide transporter, periplasmic oligopeptide-binding protein OppA (TC 3.A.1.5.1) [Halorhabdus tiamatea SARL4B]